MLEAAKKEIDELPEILEAPELISPEEEEEVEKVYSQNYELAWSILLQAQFE